MADDEMRFLADGDVEETREAHNELWCFLRTRLRRTNLLGPGFGDRIVLC